MALTELKGRQLGTQTVVIERGPVKVFAQALLDDDPVYTSRRGAGARRRSRSSCRTGVRSARAARPGCRSRTCGARAARSCTASRSSVYHGGAAGRTSATCSSATASDLRRLREGEVERRQARVLRDRDDVEERADRRARSSPRSSRSRSTASPTRPSRSRSRNGLVGYTPRATRRSRRDPGRRSSATAGRSTPRTGTLLDTVLHRRRRTSTTRRTPAAPRARTAESAAWLEKMISPRSP